MKPTTSVMLAASMLGAAGVLVFSSWPSIAQFTGGGNQSVDARIVGQTDAVSVTGEVALNSASLDSLISATNKGNCTYIDGDPTATIGTTAANIPGSPLENRTAITIWNHSNAPANALICAAGGTASLTRGIRVEHGHQWWKWEGLGGGVVISCRCTTGTCTYGFLEEQCYQ